MQERMEEEIEQVGEQQQQAKGAGTMTQFIESDMNLGDASLEEKEMRRMYLLTDEDWASLHPAKPPYPEKYKKYVQKSFETMRFLFIFMEMFQKHYSDKFKLETRTRIKAAVFYHRIKALLYTQELDNINDNEYALSCLFIAAKSDESYFKSEMCAQIYLAMVQMYPNKNKKEKDFDEESFKRDNSNQEIKKEKLTNCLKHQKKESINQQKEALIKAESRILVMLGFDFEVEDALSYLISFQQAYLKEFVFTENYNEKDLNKEEGNKLKSFMDILMTIGQEIYQFNLCLYYTPLELALGAIMFTSNRRQFVIPKYNNEVWWKFFNNDQKDINIQDDLKAQEIVEFFEKLWKIKSRPRI